LAQDLDRRAQWLEPPEEELGLKRYIETIRERLWLVVLATLVTTGVAVAYVFTAPKTYEAQADLLITPVSGETFPGLPLIRDSSDPTRDVETAARLVTNTDVAVRVSDELGLNEDTEDLLKKVSAEPVAQSNIVAVTAKEGTPEEAQELANGFAESAVAEQTESLRNEVEGVIAALEEQVAASPNPAVTDRIAELQALVSGPNPNFRVETLADLPREQASPRPALTIAGGLIGGLVLGIVGAFAAQILDPRLRREEQLRRSYNLPILARIPKESSSRKSAPMGPRNVSPAAAEAFRTLRSTLDRPADTGTGRAIMVTGSSPSEGKTTTALNLASSLALAGHRVIVIEADLRRPSVAEALELQEVRGGVVGVLIENESLEDALTPTPTYGNNLRVLPADYAGGWIAELFSIPAAREMMDDARELADFVVVDSPPLIEVVDALPLARKCDDMVIVTRIGQTRLDRLTQLAELLAENEIVPTGFAVVGTQRPGRSDYRYYLAESENGKRGRRGRKRSMLDAGSTR
jgi:capsular exopolysaccharide synthesis family protein